MSEQNNTLLTLDVHMLVGNSTQKLDTFACRNCIYRYPGPYHRAVFG